jgi:hypothetical protein
VLEDVRDRLHGISALGQKQTFAVHQPMSALPPIATPKADFPQQAMSALPPKADMCGATTDVRFGPIANIHSITWSARSSSVGAMVRSRVFAVFRLMTRLNLVGN